MRRQVVTGDTPLRRATVLVLLALAMGAVVWRAMVLHLFPEEVSARLPYRVNQHLGKMSIPARRGEIVDRNGEVLALSTPMVTVGCNPQKFPQSREKRAALAALLGQSDSWLKKKLNRYGDKQYIPLKRQVEPEVKQKIAALQIKGVEFRRGSRRFYPEGEAMASFVGFTNLKDVGQEGVELAYNDWLDGSPEQVRVVRDAAGKPIETLALIKRGEEGRRLHLTLDRRLQFLAYRSLNKALKEHMASTGSVVVVDTDRSEILAMVSLPSFNPNDLAQRKGGAVRNRAVTDLLEPGSTMKPFTVAAALDSGVVTTETVIDTSPGTFRVGRKVIREYRGHDYGTMDLAKLLQKSSNVGSAKIALMMEPRDYWRVLDQAGFGESTGSNFPGEGAGVLRDYARWGEMGQAILSYGYGVNMTPLQLARAYTALAEDGMVRPITFLQSPQGIGD
ncbi:MAG: penicillin-binding protein 2, partial [Gammaproteobacteria bacterium]|nr:penicillin-binding protein 2 [Gammaproteobacteria bacterium]